jgi:hypothetical protein
MKVYYISSMAARFAAHKQTSIPRDEYLHVATVGGDTKNDVFHTCQNIDSNWWENEHLSAWGEELACRGGLRSMMVGDIVQEGRRYFICLGVGWAQVRLYEDAFISEEPLSLL